LKIYTKTGDSGETSLIGGVRVPKPHPRIAAIGELDEANAHLGLAAALLPEHLREIGLQLESAQAHLFEIGAELAADDGRYATLTQAHSAELEGDMDAQTDALKPLTNFILPGGAPAAAVLHVARAVVRRAERAILALEPSIAVRSEVKIYVNRLSDWLFVTARTVNARSNVSDVVWNPRARADGSGEKC
jgi:cob(I)alamin adenosyltransferase